MFLSLEYFLYQIKSFIKGIFTCGFSKGHEWTSFGLLKRCKKCGYIKKNEK